MFPFDAPPAVAQPNQPARRAGPAAADMLRDAEAHQALADLFPHLKLSALRAIQDLFPLQRGRGSPGTEGPVLKARH